MLSAGGRAFSGFVSAGERACHRLTSRERAVALATPHFSYNLVTWNKGTRKVEIKPVATAKKKKRGGGKKPDRSYAKKEKEHFFPFCADDDVTLRGISSATLLPATKLGSV